MSFLFENVREQLKDKENLLDELSQQLEEILAEKNEMQQELGQSKESFYFFNYHKIKQNI